MLDANAELGEVIYSEGLGLGTYGGGAVSLLVASGRAGYLTVEGSGDRCITWPYTFVGPVRVLPNEGAQQVNFSTLDQNGGHQGCTHFRVKFEALPDDPRVEVRHIGGSGQEYRDNPALLSAGKPRRAFEACRLWASKLLSR